MSIELLRLGMRLHETLFGRLSSPMNVVCHECVSWCCPTSELCVESSLLIARMQSLVSLLYRCLSSFLSFSFMCILASYWLLHFSEYRSES